MNRKKALAARRICSYRKRGRKVSTPYLVVLKKKKNRAKRFIIRIDLKSILRSIELKDHDYGGLS